MEKFVFLNYGEGYEECINNALENDSQAYCFKPFKSVFFRKLIGLHNAWPLNKHIEMPMKQVWFGRCLEGIDISIDDDVYFLLYESFHLTYSISFLKYLHRRYPTSKLCYIFLNPVDDYIYTKVKKISPYLNAIITFNQKDAEKYQFKYCQLQPYKVPMCRNNELPKTDLFFVGADKGRLDKLIKIYEKVTAAGLKCDFHIVGVPADKQKYKNDIIYNQRISYEEVLERVYATKCVLEVLQNSEDYLSIRALEAMQYHKKLLTESATIGKLDFYNPELIQIFSDTKYINTDFIREDVDDRLYPDDILGTPKVLKKFLVDNI